MGAQRAGAPVLTGYVPPLAPFYHARQETGFGLADGLRQLRTQRREPFFAYSFNGNAADRQAGELPPRRTVKRLGLW